MKIHRPFCATLICLLSAAGAPAAEEKTFDPEIHFPRKPLVLASVKSASRLREGLSSTLLGKIATHPGTREAFSALWSQVRPELEARWAPFVSLTGKSPIQLIQLLDGEVAFVVKGMGPSGQPELALAIELGENRQEILGVLDRVKSAFEQEGNTKLPVEKVEGIEATIWPLPGTQLVQATLGTHLVLATQGTFKEIASAFSAASASSRDALVDAEALKGLSIERREVLFFLDLEKARGLALQAAGAGPGSEDVRKFLRTSGFDGVRSLALAAGFKEGGVETAGHLSFRGKPAGIVGILMDGLAPVKGAGDVLSAIPAAAEELRAVRLRPGKVLREVDALLRKEYPELGGQLDMIYSQMQQAAGISFEKDLCALGDITVYSFVVDPPAGGFISDQIALVRTDAFAPYWSLLSKLAAVSGAKLGSLSTSGGKVEYVDAVRSLIGGGRSIFRLMDAGQPPVPPDALGLAMILGALAVARTDLPGGWTAISNLPQALVRHVDHYARGPHLDGDPALAALAREKIEGAGAAVVSRGGKGILYLYNTLVSVAGSFSAVIGMAGINVAALPPAEVFLGDVRPAFLQVVSGPDGITFRGHRAMETSGAVIGAAGGAALLAGLTIPAMMPARSAAQSVQCTNNLRSLFRLAMVYSDSPKARGAFPYSPEGSLAALQLMLAEVEEEVPPSIFSCPESGRGMPAALDGKPVLAEETCSYEIVGRRVKSTALNSILMYDKTPCHHGRRNVLFTDGRVERMDETAFQQRLARDLQDASAKGEPAAKKESKKSQPQQKKKAAKGAKAPGG